MISGVLNFKKREETRFLNKFDYINPQTDCFNLKCVSIREVFFYGNFFIHKKLPYNERDFYFFDEASDILVLMTGEIFNKKEFFSEELSTPQFVAKLFSLYGIDFLNQLNGDFAIFIYRPRENKSFLIRDHLGIQPLAYIFFEDFLFFSSDILKLCKAFGENEKIQVNFLLQKIKVTDNLLTPNEKVKKIPPGHFLELNNERALLKKFWFPEKIRVNTKLSFKKALTDLDFLLKDAVSVRGNPSFFCGSHLSGGLDSSYVAVLAKEHFKYQEKFYGFSWSPEKKDDNNTSYDERIYVNKIALMNNIEPVFLDMDIRDYLSLTNDFFLNLGQFWEEKTRELAKQKKVNLLFSGWGGDEFISISESGISLDLFLKFKWKSFFEKNPIKHPRKLLKVFIYYVIFPLLGILDFETKKLFKRGLYYIKKDHSRFNKKAFKQFYHYGSRRERQLGFLNDFHLSERCEMWSILGYRKGIVYRYPLLDKRIIEYVLQVPSQYLFEKEKNRIILRKLSKGLLPEEVIWNESKLDYKLIEKNKELLFELADKLIPELMDWAKNPDLDFINFELLKKDLDKYKNNPDKIKFEFFLRNVVFFKMLHEFTKTYRSLPPTAE